VKSGGIRVLMLLENCAYPRDDRVRREARTLVAAGHRVSVIAPRALGEPREEVLEGVNVYRFRAPPSGRDFVGYAWEYGYSMATILFASLRLLWREGFDVIHAHHPPDTFAFIGAFYKLFGKRYVLDHHDLAPELYHARFGGRGRRIVHSALIVMERIACRLADHVIAPNESYRSVELQRGRVPRDRITIVRNGPDLSELCQTEGQPTLPRDERVTLGYVGVMGSQDGVDNLLKAVHHLAYDLGKTEFTCILVGSGSALPNLKSLAHELGIDEYVAFAGWVDRQSEVARYLEAMDVCVAPEPSDPYNDRSTAAKIMEYMAMGKPTVAFDLPEHRHTAGEAAAYAIPNDAMELARKIASLMLDPEKRQRMGRIGRSRIEVEFAWCHQAERLKVLYGSLQGGQQNLG